MTPGESPGALVYDDLERIWKNSKELKEFGRILATSATSAQRLSPCLGDASWALGLNAARPAILAPMIAKKGK